MAAGYRRRKGSDTWHFCGRCSTWPTSNYDEQDSKPYGDLCNECLAKATAPILIRKMDAQQRPKPENTVRPEREPPQASQDDASATRSTQLSGNITSLHKLALAYHAQKKYEEAEHVYQEALAALIAADNPQNHEYAQLLNNLGRLYFEQRRYEEAEPLYARSLACVEESLGRDHPKVARRLVNLAELYFAVGNHSEADACYRRAISIEEREFGLRHPTTVGRLRAYGVMLRNLNRIAEAETVEARAYFP